MMMLRSIVPALLLFATVGALTIGSDTVPSRQGNVVFSGVDNKMNGFAAFEGGFSFQDKDTTCSFDSIFPVSGNVDLKCGALFLSADLIFDQNGKMVNMGDIYGSGYRVKLSDETQTLTAYSGGSSTADSWGLLDTEAIGYAVNDVDWTYDGNYVAVVRGGNYLDLYSFDGSALTYVTNITTCAAPYAVRAHPSGYYFLVYTDYSTTCVEIRLYQFSGGVLTRVDYEDPGDYGRAVDWTASGNYAVTGSTDYIRIFSYASGAITAVTSLALVTGEDISSRAIVWDRTGQYFAVGITHATAAKLRIYYFNGSTITAKTYVNTGTADVTAVDWSHTGSYIAMGTNGTSSQLRVYEYNSSSDTLTSRTSVSVGASVLSVHWNDDVTRLLVGMASYGGGTEFRVYKFNPADYSLNLTLEVERSTSINAVRWSPNGSYLISGDAAYNLKAYSFTKEVSVSGDSCALIDNTVLELSDNLSWAMTSTLYGTCVIDGNERKITFAPTALMAVAAGAELTLKNVELTGLTSQNFKGLASSSSIVFQDCTINLNQDFSFGTGFFTFIGDVVFTGTNRFIYASSVVSTVSSNSSLRFEKGTTFYYAPSVANRDLLNFVDKSSCLYLNGCTLQSTTTGMRLTKGTVFVDNGVTFSSEGLGLSDSICFGNGNIANDVDIKLLSGTGITYYGGLFSNNVVG